MIRRFPHLPIKSKLNIALLLSSGIAVAVLFLVMLVNNTQRLRNEAVAQISILAQVTATNSQAAVTFNDPAAATETLAALRVKPEILAAEIRDSKHQRFAVYRGANAPSDFHFKPVDRTSFWDRVIVISRPIVVDKEPIGQLWIAADLSDLFSVLRGEMLALAIAALVAFGVANLVTNRFRTLIADPIEEVARTAQAIATDQDFSRRVALTRRIANDEVGQLIDTFNKMVGQIEDRETRLRGELERRRLAEKKLEQLAHYDTLTGLPNRFLFEQTLALTLERARGLGHQVALLFIDVDNFKLVNDSLGHATGDILLKMFAQRLTKSLRASDIVSRLGGDEFTVIIDQLKGPEHLRPIADKLVAAIAKPIQLGDREIYATASIGIALFPDHAGDADSLVRYADATMYVAKARGRANYQFFSPEIHDRASGRLKLETQLRRAIERNELFVVYQPQIDLASGRMIGCEALVRWKNLELGAVSPADFIPVAEETGLIHPIGEFVMETACRQAKRWIDEQGASLRMSVNISIRQFGTAQFTEKVGALLERTGMPAQLLELELTESCIMENVEDTLNKLRALRELGARFSIDDFGTGYSSMTYLKQLPVSIVKVDQSFVRGIPASNADMEIVRAVLLVARGLKLETVAEGVETAEQARFLAAEGCNIAQGYYFSRPVSADEITTMLRPRLAQAARAG